MDRRPETDRTFEALRRRIDRLIRQAQSGETRVNLSGRVNRAVVINTGEPGSRTAASSRQTVRIHQDGRPADADEEPRGDRDGGRR